jgi:hypothetical protein
VSAGRAAVDEVRRQQQQFEMELASSLAQERKEVQRLGAEAAFHRARACSLQEQQAHCARITSHSLRANDPERLYMHRPPMLDAHNSSVSLPPGAHGLWQARALPPALPSRELSRILRNKQQRRLFILAQTGLATLPTRSRH